MIVTIDSVFCGEVSPSEYWKDKMVAGGVFSKSVTV